MTKKNWGDNGVYKVNLIQMKIQKISEENYDWIFTNGDRLYGVKDYFGELYCKREEIEMRGRRGNCLLGATYSYILIY